MSARRVVVVSAGISQQSSTRLLADRLAAATSRQLAEQGIDSELEVVELRDHAHALTDHLLTGFPSTGLRRVTDAVARADGLIAVTPIFSASYNALFKMLFDVLEPDVLTGTPVLLAATAGSPRHSLALEHALRPLLSYLRAVTVPTAVFAASQDWGSGELAGQLSGRIDRAAGELAALVAARPRQGPTREPVVTPFAQLLAGTG